MYQMTCIATLIEPLSVIEYELSLSTYFIGVVSRTSLNYAISVRVSGCICGVPYALLFFQFGNRLYLAFHDSMFEVSKKIVYVIYFIFLIQLILITISNVAFIWYCTDVDKTLTNLFSILVTASVILYIIGYAILLHTFHRQILICATTLFINKNNKIIKNKLIDLAIKQFVCVTIASVTSAINVMSEVGKNSYYIENDTLRYIVFGIRLIIANGDFLCNIVCLLLQYSVFDQWYLKLFCCKHCDLCVRKQYINRIKDFIQLSLDVQASQNNGINVHT